MSQLDSVIFGEKKFSDILEEIYINQKKKSDQVTALISELKPLIQVTDDEKDALLAEMEKIQIKKED